MRQLTLLFKWNVWLCFRRQPKKAIFVGDVEAVNEEQAKWRAGQMAQVKGYDMEKSVAHPSKTP